MSGDREILLDDREHDVELVPPSEWAASGVAPLQLVDEAGSDVPIFFPADEADEADLPHDLLCCLRPAPREQVVLLCEADEQGRMRVAIALVGRIAPVARLQAVPDVGALAWLPLDGKALVAAVLPAEPGDLESAPEASTVEGLWGPPTLPICLARFGGPHAVVAARADATTYWGAWSTTRPTGRKCCGSTPGMTVRVDPATRAATISHSAHVTLSGPGLRWLVVAALVLLAGAAGSVALAVSVDAAWVPAIPAVVASAGVRVWQQHTVDMARAEVAPVRF